SRKVAVITPYIDELTTAVAKALGTPNREVVAAHGMDISVNVQLADPTPQQIVDFAEERLKGVEFDTLFVSCTNFRALEAVPLLEEAFGKTVLTSNSTIIEAIRLRMEGPNWATAESQTAAA